MAWVDHSQRSVARTRNKLECCASSPEAVSAGASAPRRWLGFGGRNWHVAPKARAEGKRPLASPTSLYRARIDHDQRYTARTRRRLACRASSRLRRATCGPCVVFEAAAGQSHHERTPKQIDFRRRSIRLLSMADYDQRRTARARNKLACCASYPGTASAGATAPRDTRRSLGVGGRIWHVAL